MSANVWIETPACDKCGRSDDHGAELNITYNLSKMLREAGFIGWHNLVGLDTETAASHILGVLNGMDESPGKWRAMNPENGWGSYDSCIQRRMRAWALECKEAPKGSKVGGSL